MLCPKRLYKKGVNFYYYHTPILFHDCYSIIKSYLLFVNLWVRKAFYAFVFKDSISSST